MWSPDPQAAGKAIEDLDTPCLLLDLDKVERNLDTMAGLFAGTKIRIRPHTKTHKTPKLEIMPSHCDTTINLYDLYYVTRRGRAVGVWPIASRGRSQ